MGYNIDLHNYEIKKLWQDFTKLTKVEVTAENYEKFVYVLKLHGVIIFDRFVILNNELFEDFNRFYQIDESLVFAFELVDKKLLYNEFDEPIGYGVDENEEIAKIAWKINDIFDSYTDPHKNYVFNDNCDIKSGDNYDVLVKIKEYNKKEGNKNE